MINITSREATKLAEHLNIEMGELKEKYIEESQGGQLIINTIPCHFLSDRKCSIYEHRFYECREFPHLHKNDFSSRLFGLLIHYANCPIIFNVVEALKIRTGFTKT
ncbi:MAG: YkgJ family cysteine cluster protein [Chitinophagaceae bacterium]|nr:YkgJ family cysteine cluster protein [Chitinophagaceae bacterium]